MKLDFFSSNGFSKMALWINVFILCGHIAAAITRDYCSSKKFEPSCPRDHVILMQSARFGRMHVGACIPQDRAIQMGCAKDALLSVERQCTGKRSCMLDVPNPDLLRDAACPIDLASYLEADYDCVRASVCAPSSRMTINDVTGYITSNGSSHCQVQLNTQKGQYFKVTMINFYQMASDAKHQSCINYIKFTETLNNRSVDPVTKHICAQPIAFDSSLQYQRAQVFQSLGHELRITTQYQQPEGGSSLLIHYEVHGCADHEIPPGTRLQRSGDTVDIVCNESGRAWHLVCDGSSWVGEVTGCNQVNEQEEADSSAQMLSQYPQGLIAAIITGVALGVMLGFVLLGMYIVIRFVRKPKGYYSRAAEPTMYTTCATGDQNADEFANWTATHTMKHNPQNHHVSLIQQADTVQHGKPCQSSITASHMPVGNATQPSSNTHGPLLPIMHSRTVSSSSTIS